jgi:hypothetical protein
MNNIVYNKNMEHYKEFDKLYYIDGCDGLTPVMCVWCDGQE